MCRPQDLNPHTRTSVHQFGQGNPQIHEVAQWISQLTSCQLQLKFKYSSVQNDRFSINTNQQLILKCSTRCHLVPFTHTHLQYHFTSIQQQFPSVQQQFTSVRSQIRCLALCGRLMSIGTSHPHTPSMSLHYKQNFNFKGWGGPLSTQYHFSSVQQQFTSVQSQIRYLVQCGRLMSIGTSHPHTPSMLVDHKQLRALL